MRAAWCILSRNTARLDVGLSSFAAARVSRPVVLAALVILAVAAFAGGYLSAYRVRKVKCKLRDFQAWPAAWNEGSERVNVTIFAAILTGMCSCGTVINL